MIEIKNKILYFFYFIGILTLYLLLNSIFGKILKVINFKSYLAKNISALIAEILITIIFILIYRKKFKNDIKDMNKNYKNYFKIMLKTWIIGLIFMILLNGIISNIVGNLATTENVNRNTLSNAFIYAIPSMVICAPICEEIIFRLALSKFINNKYIYIITSGLIFGYAHVMGEVGLNLLYLFPYAILGSAFAKIYKTNNDNILTTITTHSFHNLICIILLTI